MATTTNQKSRNALQIEALKVIEPELRATDPTWRRKYLRDFNDAFRDYEAVLTLQELDERIADASLILVGDYHALPSCQQFVADIMNKLSSNHSIILAVETVFSRDQHILEEWWRGTIAEKELRLRLRFDFDWGYDWDPFYNLLSSAREDADFIYGLDCMPREDLRKIHARDRHAAYKLCELRQRHSQSTIIALIGESHLAPTHLPDLLRQQLPSEKCLTILQNVDALYWRAAEEPDKTAAVSISGSTLCVFNATPLEKYASYRACLERWSEQPAEQLDFVPAIYSFIANLIKFLDLNPYSSNGRQPKYLVDLYPEVHIATDSAPAAIIDPKIIGMAESQKINYRLHETGCAYVHRHNLFIIRAFCVPAVAAEVARFLHHACQGFPADTSSHREHIEEALAHVVSQILDQNRPSPIGSKSFQQQHPRHQGPGLGDALAFAYKGGLLSRSELKKLFLTDLTEPRNAAKLYSRLHQKFNSQTPA